MKKELVLQGLLKHARSEILKEFRADSCIVSTAVGIDILNHFNVMAEPLAVRTSIFNEPFASRLSKLQSWPNKKQVEEWSKEGSYSVGIGFGAQQVDKWAGHLVVLVEKQFILDLSIDQASRPQYNMVLNPFLVEVNKEFFSGTPKVFNLNQCVIRIDLLKDNKDYLLTPDWEFKNRRSKIVTRLLQIIEKDL
jgi:hypothetical protein